MKHLLPKVNTYFKACLHTHSNISDGKLSPEQVKTEYKNRGYSILALTDHELCFAHPELNDEDFLTLTSYELMTYDDNPRMTSKTYHINFIAKDPDNRWQFHHPGLRPYIEKHVADLVFDEPMIRTYSLEQINELIAKASEKGFLAIYNHPVWSLQNSTDYLGLKGIWGAEIFNYDSYRTGYDEDMSQCYQELLCQGLPICPVASDDAHTLPDIGGGWVMIGAEKLSYESVIRAMEQGDLYASAGPEIHSLTVDGDTLHITCSEAATINLVTHGRHAQRRFPEPGKMLTEATFDLGAWRKQISEDWVDKAFFRLSVTDASGKKAWTRGYRLCDLE